MRRDRPRLTQRAGRLTRRQFLRALPAGSALALAGCRRAQQPTRETSRAPEGLNASLAPTRAQPDIPIPVVQATVTQTLTPVATSMPTATATATPRVAPPLPPASYDALPRWRGFNLVEKLSYSAAEHPAAYDEWDFDFMAEWGFNFVRLPLDYHGWTEAPGRYREPALCEIDQAIAWARARKIHVCLCLHRAPGYCVSPPREQLDLWADGAAGEPARAQFASQWAILSARYRGIAPAELSFNLLNEPVSVDGAQYLRALGGAADAVRAIDPARLLIADGLGAGRVPVPELVSLKVAQSTRGYDPMALTHYRAPWVAGSDQWPEPAWPMPVLPNQYFYGSLKAEFKSPLIIHGTFEAPAGISLRVYQVSVRAHLRLRADGITIWQRTFAPGPGRGEWRSATLDPQWNSYLALYDREYHAEIPPGTREVRIELTEGDWLTFGEIRIAPYPGAPGGQIVIRPGSTDWGARQDPYRLDVRGQLARGDGATERSNRSILWQEHTAPWAAFATQEHVGVHVGEWGVYAAVPHAVALAWMRDCLTNWRQASMGWALWNLRGPMGVVDSGRTDISYESYRGRKLDRTMLEVLLADGLA